MPSRPGELTPGPSRRSIHEARIPSCCRLPGGCEPARRGQPMPAALRRRSDDEIIMHARCQCPDSIEPLVQRVEEAAPTEIVDRTLEKLRSGVAPQTMLTASALAVVRSADLPPGHHGGPLHPLAGLHAIAKLIG